MFKCYRAFTDIKLRIVKLLTVAACMLFMIFCSGEDFAAVYVDMFFAMSMMLLGNAQFSEINVKDGCNSEFLKTGCKKESVLICALKQSLAVDLIEVCILALCGGLTGTLEPAVFFSSYAVIVLGRLCLSKVYLVSQLKKMLILMVTLLLNAIGAGFIADADRSGQNRILVLAAVLSMLFAGVFIRMSRKNERRSYYEWNHQ